MQYLLTLCCIVFVCWQVVIVMGKVRYFAIVFNNDKTVYHPGEQVTGQCLLELKSDMKMRALHMFMRGVAKVDDIHTMFCVLCSSNAAMNRYAAG